MAMQGAFTWVPMMDRYGNPILDGNGEPVKTRTWTRTEGTRPQARPAHNPPGGMQPTPVKGGAGNRFKDYPPIPNPSMLPWGGDPTGPHPPTHAAGPLPQQITMARQPQQPPQQPAGGPSEVPQEDATGLPPYGGITPDMFNRMILPMLTGQMPQGADLPATVTRRPDRAKVGGSILPALQEAFSGWSR